ncbi:hypothetical protein FE257_008461 [Aspergillus nanangensis]|uniref:Terpenoid synthase n=1 Tax=Aspergillus nanangensis TaxID=2582783 RepID=A0AAD4GUR1_ASPNN|nr:hypothetical protein FE257_008461 [Aspergillus nanangensis]
MEPHNITIWITSAGLVLLIFFGFLDRMPPFWPISKKAFMIGKKHPERITSTECAYQYIRNLYGKYHWAPFVNKLDPALKNRDPAKYKMVLEILDAIHLCLMLVDDISDNSECRKGKPAAHKIYGPSETANRAYYRVTQILNETVQRFPQLSPFLMQSLEEILEGQDISLLWRRDGLCHLPSDAQGRIEAYRKMARLKTGGLFRLLGQLVLENHSMDSTMTTLAYEYVLELDPPPSALVMNDCKNVYSSEYVLAKGSLAEDLQNSELSYPIIVALEAPGGGWVEKALECGSPRNIRKALQVLQSEGVRSACFEELKVSSSSVQEWLAIWGRNEKLNLTSGQM